MYLAFMIYSKYTFWTRIESEKSSSTFTFPPVLVYFIFENFKVAQIICSDCLLLEESCQQKMFQALQKNVGSLNKPESGVW